MAGGVTLSPDLVRKMASALLGLGLAVLFKYAWYGSDGVSIVAGAPKQSDIDNYVYRVNEHETCYKYTKVDAPCSLADANH